MKSTWLFLDKFFLCRDVFHLTVRRRLRGPGGPGHNWLDYPGTPALHILQLWISSHTPVFRPMKENVTTHTYTLWIFKKSNKVHWFSGYFCGSFTRSCHNFTHQNCVAIYCAGFPNWLASAGVIVVSLNLSVILYLLKVIKLNKYTNVQYIVYKTNKHCQVLVSCSDLNCHDHNNHALICQTGLTVILWGCLIGCWTWSLNMVV